jgi:hypothetical protein
MDKDLVALKVSMINSSKDKDSKVKVHLEMYLKILRSFSKVEDVVPEKQLSRLKKERILW